MFLRLFFGEDEMRLRRKCIFCFNCHSKKTKARVSMSLWRDFRRYLFSPSVVSLFPPYCLHYRLAIQSLTEWSEKKLAPSVSQENLFHCGMKGSNIYWPFFSSTSAVTVSVLESRMLLWMIWYGCIHFQFSCLCFKYCFFNLTVALSTAKAPHKSVTIAEK